MTETIGPIYTDLARQANALKEELNKAHVGHCSCDQCQRVDAELMAAPSLDEQIATMRGERDEARQQRDQFARGCNEWNEKFETWRTQVIADHEQQIATLMAERIQALGILNTQSRDDLLDACRQVKQVAISEADNSEKLEARLQALQGACEQLKAEAKAIVDGFHDEAINGVICTPLGDEEHGFPLWDAAPSRLWCARCKKRWERLFALPEKLAVLTAPPVPSETAEERK